ncbi:MAG: oligosaccharide flippase family protein [Fimbriimonadales bacterium]|nr:oligosaccharide flippase family protein [Fimbriimonadales bacterium]
MRPESNLRRRAVEGSVYLTVRRLIGMALALAGMLLITRIVGPENYGLFSAVVGLYTYLSLIAQLGVRVYLIRSLPDAPISLFHQAFWLLLFWSLALTGLTFAGLAVAGAFWIRTEGFMPVAYAVCAGLPLAAVSVAPQAWLEKGLNYKRLAALEVGAQLSSYAVGIPLAQLGYGVWALVASFWASLLVSSVGAFWGAHYRPQWHWSLIERREMLRFSLAQATADWLYMAKNLAPAFILLPLGGKEAAGYFALANRLLEMLNFAQVAIRRVALPVYAHVQAEPAKLLRAIYLSALGQILTLGATCLAFVLLAWYLLPPLFGAEWNISIAILTLAILASEQLLSSIFGAQAQALFAVKHPQVVARAAALFVPHLYLVTALSLWLAPPGWDAAAYALAYYWAHLPNNLLLHRGVKRFVGQPLYGVSVLWAMALSVALFAPVAYYLPLLALGVFALPVSRRALHELLAEIRAARQPPTGGMLKA